MATRYTVEVSTGDLPQPVISGARSLSAKNLSLLFDKLACGGNSCPATVTVRNGVVKASASITFASCANNDTITIGGIVITAKTAGPTGDQFLCGVSDTADAAAAAALINSTTTAGLSGVITASSVGAVLTLTASVAGKIGNAVTVATSNGTRLAITGGATRLASGAETLVTVTY